MIHIVDGQGRVYQRLGHDEFDALIRGTAGKLAAEQARVAIASGERFAWARDDYGRHWAAFDAELGGRAKADIKANEKRKALDKTTPFAEAKAAKQTAPTHQEFD